MDKIKELEKRIQELESFVKMAKTEKEDRSDTAIIWRKITPDNEGFEDNFIHKYSVKEYRNKGFGKEFEQLDFKTAIDKAGKLGDGSKKLKFWMEFQRKLIDTLGLIEYRDSDYWAELVWFTRSAIRYYQDKIIERILKEGKHFEGSGNQPYWNPDDTVIWWDKLFNPGDKKTDIYKEIRKKHQAQKKDVEQHLNPNHPTDKTIRTHLQKAGRI